ncbi:MAG: calcium-binding protein [Pirellulaceae bacterium]
MKVSETIRVEVYARAGDDTVAAKGDFSLPLWLYGESGDDRLSGGKASDVLFGGPGNDFLQGEQGRDLLIECAGTDRLNGGTDDDILIAGYTAFDFEFPAIDLHTHRLAISSILAEWNSERSYAEPQRKLERNFNWHAKQPRLLSKWHWKFEYRPDRFRRLLGRQIDRSVWGRLVLLGSRVRQSYRFESEKPK